MKDIMQITVEEVAKALKYVSKRRHIPHELAEPFKKRLVRPELVASLLGVTEVAVRSWLRGSNPVPVKREAELQILWQRIQEWERITGRLFNTPEPIRVFNSQAPERKAVRVGK